MGIDKKLISAAAAAYPVLYDVYYNTSKNRLDVLEIPTVKIYRWLYVGGCARIDYGGVLHPLDELFISAQGAQDYINRENGDGFRDRFDRASEWRAIVECLYNERRTGCNG